MRGFALVCLLLGGGLCASAGTLSFSFSGKVFSTLGTALGPIAAGDLVSGTFRYDTSESPAFLDSNSAFWFSFGSLNSIDLTVDGLTFSIDPALGVGVFVYNDFLLTGLPPEFPATFLDDFQLSGGVSADTWPGILAFPGIAGLELTQQANSTSSPVGLLGGVDLPTSFDPAAAFFSGAISATNPDFSNISVAFFSVDQVTATPEPSTAATLLLAIAAGVWEFRRKRCSR